MDSLNSDIPFDVLTRLQAKDLAELKCVSKEWQRLLSNQSFIQAQSRNTEPLSGFFYQKRILWCHDDIKTITYIPVESEGHRLQQSVFDFLPQDVVLLSSCNGLFCCRSCYPHEQPAIYICNPLNKEWINVDWAQTDKDSSIAVAFDPSQDFADNLTNFKLVRVVQMETEEEQLYFSFDTYSSKTRNWIPSPEICWCNSHLHKNNGVFAGGVLQWLTDGNQILAFDIKNEFAWLMAPPLPSEAFNRAPEACIGESDGQLHYIAISEQGLHVWLLEDRFDFEWSLKHSKTLTEIEKEHPRFFCNLVGRVTEHANVVSPWMDPLAYKDDVLLLKVATTIYLYDLKTWKLKRVADNAKFGPKSTFCPIALPYSMTLARLKVS